MAAISCALYSNISLARVCSFFCDITNQLVASLLSSSILSLVSVISYKHRYHDHSIVVIVARGVYLLLALKMMRRNVCFLNYQMLKEGQNSRDKYGT